MKLGFPKFFLSSAYKIIFVNRAPGMQLSPAASTVDRGDFQRTELTVEVDGETTWPARIHADQRQTARSVHVASVNATLTSTAYWKVHEAVRDIYNLFYPIYWPKSKQHLVRSQGRSQTETWVDVPVRVGKKFTRHQCTRVQSAVTQQSV